MRGTRLCPNLFGPGADKRDFRIFDFCFNFDFFRENPNGIEGNTGVPLGTRLFRSRVELLGRVQANPEMDRDGTFRKSLADGLHNEVDSVNRDNFIVRMHLQAVERFEKREAWDELSSADIHILNKEVAALPNGMETDDIEARLFDMTALRMQLALVQGNPGAFDRDRRRVVEIARLLEEKKNVPAVKAQLGYLEAIQETVFWEEIGLAQLEELRLRLRELVSLLDRKERPIVYTSFQDEVMEVREEAAVEMPRMTGVQYEKKVKDYLRNHQDHMVIHRLRTNQPLTETDLRGLEATLREIGEEEGDALLSSLLERSGRPSLPHFVRSLVGMDRAAAQAAFSDFLSDRSLTPKQIQFVQMVVDQLTSRGYMEAAALYEPPFSHLHAGGPDELFSGKENVIDGIFQKLEEFEAALGAKAG